MKRLLTAVVVFCLLLSVGCASNGGKDSDSAKGRMPYVVKIVGAEKTGALPAVPEECEKTRTLLTPDLLADYLAARLNESGMFTQVISGSPETKPPAGAVESAQGTAAEGSAPRSAHDLEIAVEFVVPQAQADQSAPEESMFGDGTNRVWPCVLSTGIWLFLGPVCWVIGDREYGPGEVPLHLKYEFVDAPGMTTRGSLAPRTLSVTSEYLNFLDRHDWRIAWIWNIVLPPWAGPVIFGTNSEITSENLAAYMLEQLTDQLRVQLMNLVGESYLLGGTAYLFVSDMDAGAKTGTGVIVSKVPLDEMEVNGTQSALPAFLSGKDLDVKGVSVRRDIEREMRERGSQMTDIAGPLGQFAYIYEVPLSFPADGGALRLLVKAQRKTAGSWTVRR